ncbi:MAG: phage tail protein [Niabella sp.]
MIQLPIARYHFTVNWGGTRVQFTEVSGLDIEIETILSRDGSSPVDNARKIPGLRKYANVVLKRGIEKGDNDFFNWINTKQMSNIERRDITIALLSDAHEPIVRWLLKNAFPVKYAGPVLTATTSAIAIESLELTHEGISIVND